MNHLASPVTPQQKYQHYLAGTNFQADPAQAAAVAKLEDLYHRLGAVATRRGLLAKVADRVSRRRSRPVTGLYLWGGVGRGKTFLMDILFDCLPFDAKVRMHFHRFMRRVHHDLDELAGTPNPLEQVGAQLAAEARVLCFDEFFVSDIGDAMILSELLDALFRRGVCLVATSNIAPDALYEDGLQRQRFLTAIALLEEHTESFNLDGETDFRLRLLERAEIYHAPLDETAESVLAENFSALAPDPDSVSTSLHSRSKGGRSPVDAVETMLRGLTSKRSVTVLGVPTTTSSSPGFFMRC